MMSLGPPHSSGPTPAHEAARQQQLEQARRSGWPQLELDDLVFGRYGSVEHKPTGRLYNLHRGELVCAIYTGASAYLLDGDKVRFLEDPAGTPRTVDDLAALREAKEQRRAERLRPKARQR